MKLAWVVVLSICVVACKGKEAEKTPAATSGTPPPSGGPPPTKASVQSGEIAVTGDMAGTFRWKDDLNLTCTWIPDLKGGGMDMTLTDGAGKFMALQVKNVNEVHEVTMTSGALKSAAMLKSATGYTMTGSDDRTHMTVTVDADLASAEGAKTHVKGKLELACPP